MCLELLSGGLRKHTAPLVCSLWAATRSEVQLKRLDDTSHWFFSTCRHGVAVDVLLLAGLAAHARLTWSSCHVYSPKRNTVLCSLTSNSCKSSAVVHENVQRLRSQCLQPFNKRTRVASSALSLCRLQQYASKPCIRSIHLPSQLPCEHGL